MAGPAKHELGFYLLRYVPDAVRNEAINIGIVLVESDGGFADVRFTQDWRRVLCVDPGADVEWLQAMERDIKIRLQQASREEVLYQLQDVCSSAIQISPPQGCLSENPGHELEELMKTYVVPPALHAGKRMTSKRQQLRASIFNSFKDQGIWQMMFTDIAAAKYTYPGDPLKIDCAYHPDDGVLKMFHAVSLSTDVDSAKVLAFTYPQMAAGISRDQKIGTALTAVVEDRLDRDDEAILFALTVMERSGIALAGVSEMPRLAEVARQELGL